MSPFSVTDCSIKPQIPLPENQQQQQHCDWDPLAAQSRCHHSRLLTAQPSQQIPLPGNQQQQQSMESVGLIKQSVTENGDIDSFILHQNRAQKQSSAPNWTLPLRDGKLCTCVYSL